MKAVKHDRNITQVDGRDWTGNTDDMICKQVYHNMKNYNIQNTRQTVMTQGVIKRPEGRVPMT